MRFEYPTNRKFLGPPLSALREAPGTMPGAGAMFNSPQDAMTQSSPIKHLLLAAANGDAAAQFNLGVLCDARLDDNGHAVGGHRAEALKWLLAAAEQGLPRAQNKLAEMYADGPNRPEDYVSACGWFLLAAAGLHGIHRHRARSEYERVSAYLTTAQLARARRFAGAWRPKRRGGAAPGEQAPGEQAPGEQAPE